MEVYSVVDFYILKPEITGKQQSQNFQKTQKQLTENQKNIEYRNISKMVPQFLHIASE